MCAFLAPEPVRPEWFTRHTTQLPVPLADAAADPVAWRQVLARLGTHALARIDHDELRMHRLTQAIVRDWLAPEQAASTRVRAEAILSASDPGDPADPATWPRWARLMPHLLAADLGDTDGPGLREMACTACEYLLARGDTRAARALAGNLRQQWRDRLGHDHEDTLAIAHCLGWALRDMGHYAEARDLHREILDHKRRILGEDHPSTLTSANYLAADLRDLGDPGELQAARELAEDTLARRRRVLGGDHRETLFSANNLAVILRRLGQAAAARDLNRDNLDRKRRILSEDHPSILMSAHNLALDLRDLGELEAARKLAQDTLDRRRRMLGENTPTPCAPRVAWPSSCAAWASCKLPSTWTATPWTAAAVSWVRTTPSLWPPRITWPSTCKSSTRPRSARR